MRSSMFRFFWFVGRLEKILAEDFLSVLPKSMAVENGWVSTVFRHQTIEPQAVSQILLVIKVSVCRHWLVVVLTVLHSFGSHWYV